MGISLVMKDLNWPKATLAAIVITGKMTDRFFIVSPYRWLVVRVAAELYFSSHGIQHRENAHNISYVWRQMRPMLQKSPGFQHTGYIRLALRGDRESRYAAFQVTDGGRAAMAKWLLLLSPDDRKDFAKLVEQVKDQPYRLA